MEPEAILIGYRGSITHGTYMPQNDPNSIDDKDVMSIVIPPIDFYLGLKNWGSRGTKEIKQDEWDIVVYELKKYLSLVAKSNPNVLSLLWLDDGDYIFISDLGKMLIANRDMFITKQAYHSFIGYAHGQAHRMTHMAFEGYMGEKRKRLVKQYGYDTKNAAHLIRLLRMGIEYLSEGRLYVKRQDATQLLEIKHGEWTLEQVQKEADRLFVLAHESYVRSNLPSEPNKKAINDLCVTMLKERFK
jgi:predicted nucleotidyltransferase